jgi:hypothetical protein
MPLPVLEQVTTLAERTETTVWLVGDKAFTETHAEILAPWVTEPMTGAGVHRLGRPA